MKSSRTASPLIPPWQQKLFRIINLRPNEAERTLLMFAFYTATSMGILWLEVSSAALFLDEYGASSLPWIYIFSAMIGFGLSVIYSWMQRFFPLRRVIVLIAILMAIPVLLFRWGLAIEPLLPITVFAMRLWMEAIYGLNDLNVSIAANQLFNIREIKRTFPLITSGNLVADVLSGFSVYLLITLVGLENVLLLSFIVMMAGAGVLLIISRNYNHAFPDSLKRQAEAAEEAHSAQRSRGTMGRYVVMLFSFFVLAQILMYLIEFGYLTQLEAELEADEIAVFLGIFSGLLGLIELLTQWFTSSRLIERQGVFAVLSILPLVTVAVSTLTLFSSYPVFLGAGALFLGMVILKFFDEWLRYTVVASTRPLLFQPIPDSQRTIFQSLVGGIAEPLSMGGTGVFVLVTIGVLNWLGFTGEVFQTQFFLAVTVVLAGVWLGAIYFLRSQYLELLVKSAQRGLLSMTDASLRVLKKAFVDQLEKPGPEADKRSCIELLGHLDPRGVGEVLAPRLATLSPVLQRQSLEAMLDHPRREHAEEVRQLINTDPAPEILALSLRYIWLTDDDLDISRLRVYLKPEIDPVVRGTAASLMLKHGNPREKTEAINTLRQMLTHDRERERVMGCRALGEADYMQSLRLYIPSLLQDESLRVRRALLEAIAATNLKEYYPSLLKALQYKSTREAASQALTRLGNDALPMLESVALDIYKPDSSRSQAWQAIGNIDSSEAIDCLLKNLITSWGSTRRTILRILLRLSQESGLKRSQEIDSALDRFGRDGVENLINQELTFIGQIYGALLDLDNDAIQGRETELLQRALKELQTDALERIFMLLRFISPPSAIQAAQVSWQGATASNRARGIEILDNILDIPSKRAILTVLDRRSRQDKIQELASSHLFVYQPMSPSDRLRHLLDLRYFLSDWALACCFHLARSQRWSVSAENTVASLKHPTGFVREAVLSYLRIASPRVLRELLPLMRNDPNDLVTNQIEHLMAELQMV
ncbi:HEAT repeat domain-containing protein [Oscillatoria sp. CS-180]|uniref:HEAT repeat domain-containing protein n=1 Tax=Oscillatoria sp. CS-180 TaxID=3021720 RepID=UPI00232CAFEA|nr:HEAT repeat domain-containing protein [Oscillatoria sp. CS-180]MDB9528595.1 HEAT repeat domain-containing protein [Oscillatoria sp. CS-180]